jgi:uncharacterized protein (TIGR03067 family)
MVRLLMLIVTTAIVQDAFAQDAFSEKDALKGTWSLIEQRIDGKPNPNKFLRYDLTFEDKSVSLAYETEDGSVANGDAKLSFTINTETTPKQMNWFGDSVLIQSVFSVEGDKLMIADFGKPEIARPDNLDHKKTSRSIDSPHILWVLKRREPLALKIDTETATLIKNGK